MMWRGHRMQDSLSLILVASLCCQSLVCGRVLHQYGVNTADQLVSDGDSTSSPQTYGDGNAGAAPSLDPSSTTIPNAAQPPAQQIRLRWANQVDALPPAYQAAGTGVLNDILGPSGQQTGTDGLDASPSIQPWYNSPSDAAAAPSYAAAPAAPAMLPSASQSTPSPTPVPTPAAPAPDTVTVPAAVVVPAVVALAPAPAQDEQPLVPLLGGAAPAQAPDAAPAPTPAPPLSVECSDSGSSNQMGLNVCQFMTALLPQSTRSRMCSRYLPRCPAPVVAPVAAPVAAAAATPAPAPAQMEAAAPAVGNSGSTTSDAGSLLQPLLSGLESIFGGSQSANGNSSGSGLAMLG